MVIGLLLVDVVILLTWQLYDPLQRRIEVFPLEDPVSSEDDIKIRPELEHCESDNNNVWLGEGSFIFLIQELLNLINKINAKKNMASIPLERRIRHETLPWEDLVWREYWKKQQRQ